MQVRLCHCAPIRIQFVLFNCHPPSVSSYRHSDNYRQCLHLQTIRADNLVYWILLLLSLAACANCSAAGSVSCLRCLSLTAAATKTRRGCTIYSAHTPTNNSTIHATLRNYVQRLVHALWVIYAKGRMNTTLICIIWQWYAQWALRLNWNNQCKLVWINLGVYPNISANGNEF